jgi:serine/threonine protein kinase
MSQSHQPLRKIFNEAVEIADAQQRADYLAAACGTDTTLLQRIEELIEANENAGLFLGGTGNTAAIAVRNVPSDNALSQKPGDRAIRDFGNYQLLEEIARGGMGVVFKARQTTLHRTVALKMILAGKLASPALVQRFHTEAEAAANLTHPNIVAIHEVGEHEGQHYFSMDYIEGQNLAERMRQGPMPLKQAAGCVRTIAGAIHYAHQRGVLHRDLKPSNILLDGQGRPHVTDFGLAKLVEQESSLTQSQDVMGTPGYMAPEQAAGDMRQLTIAADIYSLGAILYELLTGRPPFRASTPLETMRQVMEQEPEPPSLVRNSRLKEAHNPKPEIDPNRLTSSAAETLDRDLETICLKCLEKDPQRRYASAGDLAEDLEHWERFEPVRARPISSWVRVQRWTRRNRMGTALIVTLFVSLVAALTLWQLKHIETRHLDLTMKTFQRQILREITALGDKPRPYVEINSDAFAAAVLGRPVSGRKVEKAYCVALFVDRSPLGTPLEYGPLLSFLERAVSEAMHKPIALNLRLYRDEPSAVADLVAGEVHFMRMPPLSYIGAHSLNPDIRPLVRPNKEWTAVIFTRLGNGIDHLADLRGKSLAFDEETHMMTCLAKATFAAAGINGADLREYKFANQLDQRAPGTPEVEWEHEENYSKSAPIKAVLTGGYDAGVAVLNRFYRVHEGKEFKTLATFQNVSAPWVAGPRMEAGAQEAFRRAMVELDDMKILDALPGIPVRYINARDGDYATVRAQIPLLHRFDAGTNTLSIPDSAITHNTERRNGP